MQFLDTAGLTSLWGKVKELTSPISEAAEGVVVTKPTAGETLTAEAFTKLKSAVDNKYKINIVETISDVTKTTTCVYSAADANTVTLSWVDSDSKKLISCKVNSSRTVSYTELSLEGGSSSGDNQVTLKPPLDSEGNLLTGDMPDAVFYDNLRAAIVARKLINLDISIEGDSSYNIVCPAAAWYDTSNSTTIILLFFHPGENAIYRYNIYYDDEYPYAYILKTLLDQPKMYTIDVARFEAGVTTNEFDAVLAKVKNAMLKNTPLYAVRNESDGVGDAHKMLYVCPITINYYGNIKNGTPQFKSGDMIGLVYYYYTGDHVNPSSYMYKVALKMNLSEKSIVMSRFLYIGEEA